MAKKTNLILSGFGFTADESKKIVENGVIRFYPRNSIVLQTPHLSESLFIVLEGRLKALAVDSEGIETTLAYYKIGNHFGSGEFGDAYYALTVRAIEPSRLLELRVTWLKTSIPQASASAREIFLSMINGLEKQGEKLSEAIQQKQAITEILRAISTSPSDLIPLLNTVAESAARFCDAEDASIMQVENNNLRLVAQYGSYQSWDLNEKRQISRDWVTGRAVVDCKPVHVLDLQTEKADYPLGAEYALKYGHRTTYAVPLIRDSVAIGAILIRRQKVDPVTEKQRDLLRAFADQAAIAIENVRLFNEINEKSNKLQEQSEELAQWNQKLEIRVSEQVAKLEQFAKLEHELKVASDIQKSMLPKLIPYLEGYEIYANLIPAKSVGGDFYEFIPLTEDSTAIAIGDVADKGVPAALFMAMVLSFLRAEVNPGVSPKTILERVNKHLLEVSGEGIFVTILLGILNNKTHQFIYSRAGHELPILIDYKGAAKQLYKGDGQALGVFDMVSLDEQIIDLSDNSLMVLYTDGISDAINQQNQMFGIQGILRTICRMTNHSVPNMCDELFHAVMSHQKQLPQFDDMTAVVVKAVTV
jgi:serine phosphatase RsbU (regulator of sigma subunit)/CRP-like cAMP-binding protein